MYPWSPFSLVRYCNILKREKCPLSNILLMTLNNSKYRNLNSVYMECNACCFGRCKNLGHWLSKILNRGQKRFLIVNVTLKT